MSECDARATRYGIACFLHTRIAGEANTRGSMTEWVGPQCLSSGIRRSASARTESARAKGMLISAFSSFDEVFPVM